MWLAREGVLRDKVRDYRQRRATLDFDELVSDAIGAASSSQVTTTITGIAQDLQSELASEVANAESRVRDELFLTPEAFKRLSAIRLKARQTNPKRQPTAAEWEEVYAMLVTAYKRRALYPTWLNEEAASGLLYWSAAKAMLPPWRATADVRRDWQLALRERSRGPIIDPDVIAREDLRTWVGGAPHIALWDERRLAVDDTLDTLRLTRENGASERAGLDEIVLDVLSLTLIDHLLEADSERANGQDVEPRLSQLGLDFEAFDALIRVRRLASATGGVASALTEEDWADVYAILTQVWKRRATAEWNIEEANGGVVLSPEQFVVPQSVVIPALGQTLRERDLPKWLATPAARRDWLGRLSARAEQRDAVKTGTTEAADAAEQATLALLRDALVAAVPASTLSFDQKADWVTRRFRIDAKVDTCRKTTRIEQAIETLQDLLFSARGHFLPTLIDDRFSPQRITAVARKADYIDLFAVGADGRVHSTWWNPYDDWTQNHQWFWIGRKAGQPLRVPHLANVAAVALQEDQIDLFVVAEDGAVYNAWWTPAHAFEDSGWRPMSGTGGAGFPPGAYISAIASQPNRIDLFAIDANGVVVRGLWDNPHQGNTTPDWLAIPGANNPGFPPGAPVAAVSRITGQIDLFAVGNDGRVHSAYFNATHGWAATPNWFPIVGGNAFKSKPGAEIAAVARVPDSDLLEIFAPGEDGGIHTAKWTAGSSSQGWNAAPNWRRIGADAAFKTAQGAAPSVVSRHVENLDAFAVRADGVVVGAYFVPWHGWEKEPNWFAVPGANNFRPEPGTHVTGLARKHGSHKLDLFAVGNDGGVYTSTWTPNHAWNLTPNWLRIDGSLGLDAPQFDEEWKWLGTYATWRAAMLVWLYPRESAASSAAKASDTRLSAARAGSQELADHHTRVGM